MQPLHDIQQAFFRVVYENEFSLSSEIKDAKGLNGESRLKVYQSSILGIQTDALAAVYPVIKKLVGDEFFLAMGKAYLRKYFSPSGDLHNLGGQMAEFLQDFEPAKSLPYLADVAKLEWIWHRIFHAADEENLDFNELAKIPVEQHGQLQFYLRDGARLLASPYPVHRIWQLNQDDCKDEESVDLDEGGVQLLVTRNGYEIEMHPLNDDEWKFLQLIQLGVSLSGITEKIPEYPLDELLPQCVAKGWINRFEIRA